MSDQTTRLTPPLSWVPINPASPFAKAGVLPEQMGGIDGTPRVYEALGFETRDGVQGYRVRPSER